MSLNQLFMALMIFFNFTKDINLKK